MEKWKMTESGGYSMREVFVKKSSYDIGVLREDISQMMEDMGGVKIRPGSKVLVKPNLLLAAPPEKAVTTHPLVVRAVVEYILEKGGKPVIADSPATGSISRIMAAGGYAEALKGLDVGTMEFTESVKVDLGRPFGEVEVAREAVETDLVINLPKLKTHVMMLLTLGVKNLFGCIVGLRKPRWHLRVGVDKEMFAGLLVEVCRAVNPCITIVDGITAMEGQGPGRGGIPRHLGVLVGGTNPFAVDMAISQMLGLNDSALETSRAAMGRGYFSGAPLVKGDTVGVSRFDFPDQSPVTFGPKQFHGFIRRHLVQRPVVNPAECKMCGKCWEYCPAKAITAIEKGLEFDYDACIRCYCCIEVCPHGALGSVEPLAGKILRKIKG